MRSARRVYTALALAGLLVMGPACGAGMDGEAETLGEASGLPLGPDLVSINADPGLGVDLGGRTLPQPLTPVVGVELPDGVVGDRPTADGSLVPIDLPVLDPPGGGLPVGDIVVVPPIEVPADFDVRPPAQTPDERLTIRGPADVIKIKFHDHFRIRLRGGDPRIPGSGAEPVDLDGRGLTGPLAQEVLLKVRMGQWARTHIPGEDTLDELRKETNQVLGLDMPDLNNYFALKLPPRLAVEDAVAMFKNLREVETVAPMRDYYLAAAPDYSLSQGTFNFNIDGNVETTENEYQRYLEPAPVGVDARFAWNVPGGDGSGVHIVDIESAFDRNHPDLPPIFEDGLAFTDEPNERNISHGTATFGVLVGLDNGEGVRGIAHGADPYFLSKMSMEDGIAGAISWATDLDSLLVDHIVSQDARPGDVIVLEVQVRGPNADSTNENSEQWGLVAAEWEADIFHAIRHATAHGFVVIEAAGNGWQDLDDADHQGHPDAPHDPFVVDSEGHRVNDSGAIIVGAGVSNWGYSEPMGLVPRSRKEFSNYGKRVDVQAWGEWIVTLGPGREYTDETGAVVYDSSLYDQDDMRVRSDYGGTSGATAILGGVAAALQGAYQATGLGAGYLSSKQVRDILIRTGTPQTGNLNEHIGPMPNLRDAILEALGQELELLIEPWDDYCGGTADETPPLYAPEFSMQSGMVAAGTNVIELYPRFGGGVYVEGSSIYYTTDGYSAPNVECDAGEPGCEGTFEYTLEDYEDGLPILIDADVLPIRIQAITGIQHCWIADHVVSDPTTLVLAPHQTIASPGMNVDGTGEDVCVALTSGIGPQANIRYTLDGGAPTDEGNIWDAPGVPGTASPLWSDCYTDPEAYPGQCGFSAAQCIPLFAQGITTIDPLSGQPAVKLRARVFKNVGFNHYAGGDELCVVFPENAPAHPCTD